MPGDPERIYRAFRGIPEHLVALPTGGFRLKSSWFRVTGGGVSVDDGALSSASETQARNMPCGVASVRKDKITGLGYELTGDPQDTPEDLKRNPGHRLVLGVTAKDAKRIAASAVIEVALEGWQVVATQ